jgi:ribosomal protein S27E
MPAPVITHPSQLALHLHMNSASDLSLECDRCGFELIKPAENGRSIVRARLAFIDRHSISIRCKICGSDTTISL